MHEWVIGMIAITILAAWAGSVFGLFTLAADAYLSMWVRIPAGFIAFLLFAGGVSFLTMNTKG